MAYVKKLLVTRESPVIQSLRNLIEKQNHRTLVMWVIEYGKKILPIFEEKYPDDKRPRQALEAAEKWARGEIKMPEARKFALGSHKAASEVEDLSACAAARAIGHVVGTVHVETHALGLVCFGITALIRNDPDKDCEVIMAEVLDDMYEKLLYWERETDKKNLTWASFLQRDDIPNKEKLLHERNDAKKHPLA